MTDRDWIKERAVDARCLDQRIIKNVQHQKIDLVEWIFARIDVEPGSKVLELCCGTGNQTLKLIDFVDSSGCVIAVDISEEALLQLRKKVNGILVNRLKIIPASIDKLPEALDGSDLESMRFDLIFCAYGLYYSENPQGVLNEMLLRLAPHGRIAIVGPFGLNNGPLFRVLENAGVAIPDYVRYTSQDFMEDVVIPFAVRHFESIHIYTMINPVIWPTEEDVLKYWENSTYYDEARKRDVRYELKRIFESKPEFVNEKWAMMITMSDATDRNSNPEWVI